MVPIHAKFQLRTIKTHGDRGGGRYSTENVTALLWALHDKKARCAQNFAFRCSEVTDVVLCAIWLQKQAKMSGTSWKNWKKCKKQQKSGRNFWRMPLAGAPAACSIKIFSPKHVFFIGLCSPQTVFELDHYQKNYFEKTTPPEKKHPPLFPTKSSPLY